MVQLSISTPATLAGLVDALSEAVAERVVAALVERATPAPAREDAPTPDGYQRGGSPAYGAHDTGADVEGEPA